MSIRSKREILNDNANAEGASNEAILMAALNESQEQYKKFSAAMLMEMKRYNTRIGVLEAAVKASNEQKGINIQAALQNAADTVLGGVQGKVDAINAKAEQALSTLQKVEKQKDKDEFAENVKMFGLMFVLMVSAFYVALLLYGWWYDIPEAISGVTKSNAMLEAINNGIYQLLNK